jgi:hypothetical protein
MFPALLIAAVGCISAATPVSATLSGPVGQVPAFVAGPYGMRLLAPAATTACVSGAMTVRFAARWSVRALARPVRSIRVLLQRPGSEAVIASEVFAPARPSTTRRTTLRTSQCRENLDVRYELFVGRQDVPHDHQSVVFGTHGTPTP